MRNHDVCLIIDVHILIMENEQIKLKNYSLLSRSHLFKLLFAKILIVSLFCFMQSQVC